MRTFYRSLTLILTGCLLLNLNAAVASSVPNHPHISLNAKGEVSAKPDTAILTLQVRAEHPTSLAAKQEVDKRVNNLLAGLKPFAVTEKDISASSLQTEPNIHYDKGESKIIGYRARRNLTIKLHQLELLSDFMDYILSVEINEINRIQLTVKNSAELEQQALQKAIANARQQAEFLAHSFDAKLGSVFSIRSGVSAPQFAYGPTEVMRSMVASDSAAPGRYLEESITFDAQVDVVFSLTF